MKLKRYTLPFLIACVFLTGLEYMNFAALEKDMDTVQAMRGNNSEALQDATAKKKAFCVLFIVSVLGAACALIQRLSDKQKS